MKLKPVADIQDEIIALDGIQKNMEARQRVLMDQVEDLERDIQRIGDSRGGLILFLERHHGVS